MDSPEQARREHERIMKARERLRFRVFAAVRDVAFQTELFRSHPEFYEPDIFVNVYSHWVDANTALNEGQVRLLPVHGRSRDLTRYAEQLRAGIEKAAPALQLEFTTDPARFGGSQPVMLADIPIGYRAVLVRHERD